MNWEHGDAYNNEAAIAHIYYVSSQPANDGVTLEPNIFRI